MFTIIAYEVFCYYKYWPLIFLDLTDISQFVILIVLPFLAFAKMKRINKGMFFSAYLFFFPIFVVPDIPR